MRKLILFMAAALIGIAARPEVFKPDKSAWEAGKYFHVATSAVKEYVFGDRLYLSADGNHPDSVTLRALPEGAGKAAIDSTLWRVEKACKDSVVLVNKATNKPLCFHEGKLTVAGDDTWSFDVNGFSTISCGNGDGKTYLGNEKGKLVLEKQPTTVFRIVKPDPLALTLDDLTEGLGTARLFFGRDYDGNIFDGKALSVTAAGNGCFHLQDVNDPAFDDGKPKYLMLDTLKETISGQTGSFGLKFKGDSLSKDSLHAKFRFVTDLSTDSTTVYVQHKADSFVVMSYSQQGDKFLLTVSDTANGKPKDDHSTPLVYVKHGLPVNDLADGVYFILDDDKHGYPPGGGSGPATNNSWYQWMAKKNGDYRYDLVNRRTGLPFALGTFLYKGDGDTIRFAYDGDHYLLDDVECEYGKYMGNLRIGKDEEPLKGITLDVVAFNVDCGSVTMDRRDSLLLFSDEADPMVFHVEAVKDSVVGGAKILGDTLHGMFWRVWNDHGNVKVVDKAAVITKDGFTPVYFEGIGGEDNLFRLVADSVISAKDGKLGYFEDGYSFDVSIIDDPLYDDVEEGYISFLNDNYQYLTRDVKDGWAKYGFNMEPQRIGNYEWQDFVFAIQEADTTIAGQPVYTLALDSATWYLAAIDTCGGEDVRVGYVQAGDSLYSTDAILWSLKLDNEDGTVKLENILTGHGKYVGDANGKIIMNYGRGFQEQKSDEPTANEAVVTKETGVHGGEGCVVVDGADGKELRLYGIDGTLTGHWLVTGDRFIVTAPQGVVIATLDGGKGTKLLVR